MSQAWLNDRMTPESYGKAIVKSSKTFIVSWDTALHTAAVPLCGRLSGQQALELLEKHFMSASLFTTINSRIQQWASALIVACAAHPEATLRDLITGPLPAWWTFYQTNGFDVQMGAPAQGQRTPTHEYILRELNSIESAYSIKSSLIVISDIVGQFIANDHKVTKLE